MSDEFRRLGNLLEPPWDEVRERRVLARIEERWEAGGEPESGRTRRWMVWAAAAAAVVGFGLFGVWYGFGKRSGGGRSGSVGGAPATTDVRSAELSLGQGVWAYPGPGAEVAVLARTDREVRVRQEAGRVRYVVRHAPGRRFVVEAPRVIIEDLATVFTVEVGRRVRVAVEEGAVRVLARGRWHRLDVGMELVVGGRAEGDEGRAASGPGQQRDDQVVSEPRDRTRPRPPRRRSGLSEPRGGRRAGGRRVKVDLDALFEAVDAARRAGRLGRAARLLREMIRSFPADPRVGAALFTLGRVELVRGRSAEAARAFRRCYRRSPSGPLAEDALAAEARAWARAGQVERARRAAELYVNKYPSGTHVRAMKRILERSVGGRPRQSAGRPTGVRTPRGGRVHGASGRR